MRRIFTLTALFAIALAGIGCKHIAGRCDCTHHAEDARAMPATNPYPVVGGAAPAVMPDKAK